MAVSADVPEPLLLARRTLEEVDGVQVVRDWHRGPEGWRLRVNLTPGDLGDVFPIAETTPWYVVCDPGYPGGQVSISPDKDGGISGTFPHQIPNYDLGSRPYRSGKICIATDSENNLRSSRDAEPTTGDDRLAWHLLRALEWVRRASKGTLLPDGDWFELPVYALDNGPIVFHEGPATLDVWRRLDSVIGFADIVELPMGVTAVKAFRGLDSAELVEPAWGDAIFGRAKPRALWIRLPDVVVTPPYQAPLTFGELRAAAASQGIDLDQLLHQGTASLRDRQEHLLLIGFPVPERMGEPARQMHWQPVALPRLEGDAGRRRGPVVDLWPTTRKGTLRDEARVNWKTAENWHPDQLATRGRLERGLTDKRVVVLGAGALGSVVAELLVRAGVTDITIVDHDALAAGNLVRHTLTMADLNTNKAKALVRRLRSISPSVRAFAVEARFPGQASDEHALAADLVVDTTAEHAVLEAMPTLAWANDPTFVSLAISMHARRLFAFISKGTPFDLGAFDAAYEPFALEELERDEERPWEGVGCWHPVFPARADEVAIMAATAIGMLNDIWPVAPGPGNLQMFERQVDQAGRFAGVCRILP